jgi:hypothetical protein
MAESTASYYTQGVNQSRQALRNTRLCTHFQKRRCKYGSNCNFAHDEVQLKPKPDLLKVVLCARFMGKGRCPMGDNCRFAHGQEELRIVSERELNGEDDVESSDDPGMPITFEDVEEDDGEVFDWTQEMEQALKNAFVEQQPLKQATSEQMPEIPVKVTVDKVRYKDVALKPHTNALSGLIAKLIDARLNGQEEDFAIAPIELNFNQELDSADASFIDTDPKQVSSPLGEPGKHRSVSEFDEAMSLNEFEENSFSGGVNSQNTFFFTKDLQESNLQLDANGQNPNALKYTKLCDFYARKRCKRGDKCQFAHYKEQLQPKPDLFKTIPCARFERGKCQQGTKCKYAHGMDELRMMSFTRTSENDESAEDESIKSSSISMPSALAGSL